MTPSALVRAVGAGHRHTVASHYHNHGGDLAYRLAKRYVEETAAEVCEAHSRRDAYDMLMKVADRLVANRDLDDVAPFSVIDDVEEPTPGVKAAIDRVGQGVRVIELDRTGGGKVVLTGIMEADALRELVAELDAAHAKTVKGIKGWWLRHRPAPWVLHALMGFVGALLIK